MKTGMIVGLVAAASITSVVAVGAVSYISAYNVGNRLEQEIKATYKDNENILAQYGQKVVETAQVSDMYRDDVIKLTEAAIQGRYGADGSKAFFQALTEQNPTLDPAIYVQIQRVIEAGRNDFQSGQSKLISQKKVYETNLGSFWTGTWMTFAGYPKIDLAQYDIVSTERATVAFETKREEPIKLRQ